MRQDAATCPATLEAVVRIRSIIELLSTALVVPRRSPVPSIFPGLPDDCGQGDDAAPVKRVTATAPEAHERGATVEPPRLLVVTWVPTRTPKRVAFARARARD